MIDKKKVIAELTEGGTPVWVVTIVLSLTVFTVLAVAMVGRGYLDTHPQPYLELPNTIVTEELIDRLDALKPQTRSDTTAPAVEVRFLSAGHHGHTAEIRVFPENGHLFKTHSSLKRPNSLNIAKLLQINVYRDDDRWSIKIVDDGHARDMAPETYVNALEEVLSDSAIKRLNAMAQNRAAWDD
ncbi:hypothetical protein [Marinimicrobium sp. ABcell2]|uniref:hypothetical protein n=1 Tax=Marinimicrobium sp. ABcell2 TaxID=3069751 RepID=UPI0027B7C767|nr:hypothetical protein [Marinimicrobium sp. ABcell2]MDQ2077379.1 hypothetical protein [Marinimicrobium sp. ABcell2]